MSYFGPIKIQEVGSWGYIFGTLCAGWDLARGFNQCIDKKSLLKQWYYVGTKQTDLLKYSTKDWI